MVKFRAGARMQFRQLYLMLLVFISCTMVTAQYAAKAKVPTYLLRTPVLKVTPSVSLSHPEEYRKAVEKSREYLELYRDSLEMMRKAAENLLSNHEIKRSRYDTVLVAYLAGIDTYKFEFKEYQNGISRYKAGENREYSMRMEVKDVIPSFPWPPPKSSSHIDVQSSFLVSPSGQTLLKDVASRLEDAFDSAGYVERSYYAIPGGFAIASQLEQMNDDGTSKDAPDRWSAAIQPQFHFSLGEFIAAIFHAHTGRFRIIVFVVTSRAMTQADSAVPMEEARNWVNQGANKLPSSIGNLVYSDTSSCTALIYEYTQSSVHADPQFVDPNQWTADKELELAGIWDYLRR